MPCHDDGDGDNEGSRSIVAVIEKGDVLFVRPNNFVKPLGMWLVVRPLPMSVGIT